MVRTSASSSSGRKPPPSATVTACCASRSSGRSTGPPRLDLAGLERGARRGHVHQLQRVGRHAGEPAHRARLVPAPPGALDQPAHALRAADLEDAVHRREVHAEVERRGADHAAELALAESVLHPLAGGAVHRAVVQGQDAGPVGPRFEQRLKPDLGGGPGVGEDERGLAFLDRGDHLGEQPEADLSRPGEALHGRGDERIDLERLGDEPLDDSARPRRGRRPSRPSSASRAVSRLPSVAERPSVRRLGPETTQPRQAELGLHAPLRGHQLVPLVHHDELEVLEQRGRIVAGEQERQALGRGDQRGRQALALAGADAGGGVAGAGLDRPREAEILDRGAKRGLGVGRRGRAAE